jgi:membrane protease YdiL (CAAX protease family)
MNSQIQASAVANWTWRASLDVALLTLLLNAVLSFLLSWVLQDISNLINIQILGSPIGTTILGAAEASLLIPLLVYSKRLEISRFQLGLHLDNLHQSLADIISGALMGLAMVPASIILSAINEMILGQQPGAEYIQRAFTIASPFEAVLLLSAIIFVVAPVEEFVSRGFIQQGLERSFGKLKGLVLASLFFSVMHLNLWSILPLMLLGMMLGSVFRLRHGRILAPITSHAVYMICLVAIASS